VSRYDLSHNFATTSPANDLKRRIARARGKAKRRLLGVERHRQTGRWSLVYSPLGEPLEGYEGTTLGRIEHALETIPIKPRRLKRHCRASRRPIPVVVDQHLNADGQYA
jgi:hypothetical protein